MTSHLTRRNAVLVAVFVAGALLFAACTSSQSKSLANDSRAAATQLSQFQTNQPVPQSVASCPSIGFPIPSTYQLTNPQQKVAGEHGNVTLPQIEATGVYTDQSTGTYVICVDAQGRTYADYWEGFVKTVTGPAKWNPSSHQVELTGPPSFNFTKGK